MKDTIKFWKTGIGNAIELKNYLFEKNEYGTHFFKYWGNAHVDENGNLVMSSEES